MNIKARRKILSTESYPKLYFFECGTLKSKKHLFTKDRGIEEFFEVPVPFFLIQYNNKNILFDTGNALEVAKYPQKHWGDMTSSYLPIMKEEQYVVNQLKTLGIKPENVDYVILSHLHLDHAGGVGDFPNATYITHKKEFEWAFDSQCPQKGAYIMKDINKDVKWLKLENKPSEAFDLFKDGVIKIYPTPGHTPGHISVLVNLQNSNSMFLTSDSCYTEENINDNIAPGLAWNVEESIKTINWIKELQAENIEIIAGHDPKAWKRFKKAPQYYS